MKKIFTSLVLLSVSYTFGQNPVYNLSGPVYNHQPGAYYKDSDNELDNFTGTWIYTNSSGTSLELKLRKVENEFFSNPLGGYYEDALVGSYKYIENGTVIINTIPTFYSDIAYWKFNINGNHIIPKDFKPSCEECLEGEKRVELSYTESDRLYIAAVMILRRADEGGQHKIKVRILQRNNSYAVNGVAPQFNNMSIPFGEYELIKQ